MFVELVGVALLSFAAERIVVVAEERIAVAVVVGSQHCIAAAAVLDRILLERTCCY